MSDEVPEDSPSNSSSASPPHVSWSMLYGEDANMLQKEQLMMMYTAFLKQLEGPPKYVVYKIPKTVNNFSTLSLQHEARVLEVLDGVDGVPQLCGLTDPPKVALVMSYCPGIQLRYFIGADSAHTYLGALRKACLVLKAMHDRGIVHTNLQHHNILVELVEGSAENMSVSVVGLHEAKIGVDNRCEKWCDVNRIIILAQNIRICLPRDSPLYARCEEFERITRLNPLRLDWMVVLVTFCRVLHRERPPMCTMCKEEVWKHFNASTSELFHSD